MRHAERPKGHMKKRCFEIAERGVLIELDGVESTRLLQRGAEFRRAGEFWIDVTLDPGDDVREFLRSIAVSDRTIEACSHESRSRRFESSATELYFECPVQIDWKDTSRSHVSFILTTGMLVTVHRRALAGLERVARGLSQETMPGTRLTPLLLTRMLVELGRESVDALLEIRDQADTIAERLDDRPESIATDDIISLRRRADHTTTAFLDQLSCLTRLSLTESDVFSAKAQAAELQEVLDRVKSADVLMTRVEKRIEMLLNQFNLVLQDKSNYRLQILTIVSAVFMPLGLIVGIYGMNFEHMPILRHPYGYQITLGAMAALAAGMLVWFKRRRWY